jgi:hypothetical protein
MCLFRFPGLRKIRKNMVDVAGLEPAALCLQSRCGKTLKCFDGVPYTDFQ